MQTVNSVSSFFLASLVAFSAVASSVSDRGDHFTDEEPIALELGGKTREVESWHQSKWNGQALSVTNGTLVFTKSVGVHGGRVNIGPGTRLRGERPPRRNDARPM